MYNNIKANHRKSVLKNSNLLFYTWFRDKKICVKCLTDNHDNTIPMLLYTMYLLYLLPIYSQVQNNSSQFNQNHAYIYFRNFYVKHKYHKQLRPEGTIRIFLRYYKPHGTTIVHLCLWLKFKVIVPTAQFFQLTTYPFFINLIKHSFFY